VQEKIPNVIKMLQALPNADQSLQLQAPAKSQLSMFDAGAEEYSEKEKDRKASGDIGDLSSPRPAN
jgi:hypothetical protein